jgi:hypothetical protein
MATSRIPTKRPKARSLGGREGHFSIFLNWRLPGVRFTKAGGAQSVEPASVPKAGAFVLANLAYSVFNPVSKLEPYLSRCGESLKCIEKAFSSAFSWLDALSQHTP